MPSLNHCMFMGNATSDADLKYTPSGFAMASFGLAVNDRKKNKEGKYEEVATFLNCVMLGDTAEKMSQYINKGKPYYIEGKLQIRTWDNDQGVKQYRTEILVNNIQFLASRDGGGQGQRPQKQQANSNTDSQWDG